MMKSWLIPLALLAITAVYLGANRQHDSPDHSNATGAQNGANSEQHSRVSIIFDTTTENRLAVSRAREATVLARLSREDRAALYTLDQSCTEVFSPDQKLPSGFDNALLTLVKRIKSSPNRGTYPYKAWQKLAREVQHDPSPTVIIWETDGDEDQEAPEAREVTKKAIATLAPLPHLRHVILVGINPEQRERVRKELAPLEGRYTILEKDTKPSQLTGLIRSTIQAPAVALSSAKPTSYKGGSR